MQAETIAETLGQMPRPLAERPAHGVVIAQEKHTLTVGEAPVALEVVLSLPAVELSSDAVLKV